MNKLAPGTVHVLPLDLETVLGNDKETAPVWNALTPLARNEWICWVENAKAVETRNRRITRIPTELAEGIRRPCCWIGCIHRTDKAISPSVQGILSKKSK